MPLRLGVAALAVVLVGCIVALVALQSDPAAFRSLRDTAGAPVNAGGSAGSTGAGRGTTTGSGSGDTGASVPSSLPGLTTTAPVPAVSGGPIVSSLEPAQGAAGQSVTISGRNFLSADNTIVANFGPDPAHTSCPSAEQCVATAPAGLSGTVQVRVRTDSGSSNAVAFAYRTR